MEPTIALTKTRGSLESTAGRVADVLRSLSDSSAPIPNSEWTVREAAAHLTTMMAGYVEIATGTPGPIADFAPDTVAERNNQYIADIAESDPGKLAALVIEATSRFVEVTAGRPGEQELTYLITGIRIDLASLAGILLGETLLHGYDIARATAHPWPIDPADATLVLRGYAPIYGMVVNPETSRGHTATYKVQLRDGPCFIVRFVNGEYRLEPSRASAVDCVISADPVAYLMVSTGRLGPWEAIALGLIEATGTRPELALRFNDLFSYP